MTTHYMTNATDDGVLVNEAAGENTGSTPDWVYRMTARYTLDDFTFNLTARGHSDGVVDNTFIECATNCGVSTAANRTINDNSVDGEWYFDAYLAKGFAFGGGEGEVFLSVKKMFDTDPALVTYPLNQGSENRAGYQSANRNLSDMLGRNFRMGMRCEC